MHEHRYRQKRLTKFSKPTLIDFHLEENKDSTLVFGDHLVKDAKE